MDQREGRRLSKGLQVLALTPLPMDGNAGGHDSAVTWLFMLMLLLPFFVTTRVQRRPRLREKRRLSVALPIELQSVNRKRLKSPKLLQLTRLSVC